MLLKKIHMDYTKFTKTCQTEFMETRYKLGKVGLFRIKLIPILFNKPDKHKYGYLFYP